MDHVVGAERGRATAARPRRAPKEDAARTGGPLDNQSNRDRRRMPARGSEAFQWRSLGGRLVEMEGLGIDFRRKALDVFARNQLIGTFKTIDDKARNGSAEVTHAYRDSQEHARRALSMEGVRYIPWRVSHRRDAQKFQLLEKLGGNCSLMPVKAWKFGAPTPAR